MTNLSIEKEGQYEVFATNSLGCISLSSVIEVIFSEKLLVNSQSDLTLEADCTVSEIRLVSNITGDGPFIYNWSGPNNFTSSEANPIIISDGITDLNGSYNLTVFDNNNCAASTSTMVNIEEGVQAPMININQRQLCVGDSIHISATSISGEEVSYLWSGPLGSTLNGNYTDLEVLLFTEVRIEDAGLYTVSVLVDGCLSEASESILLEVNELPVIDLPNEIITCFDSTTELTLPLEIISGQGPLTYNWIGPDQFQSNLQNPTLSSITSLDEGIYSVIVSDPLGCASETMQLLVNLEEIPLTPIISNLSSEMLCEGDELILAIDNFNPSLEYTWVFRNGSIIQQNDSILIIDEALIAEHNGTVSIFSADGNCPSEESENITINISPKPEIIGISNSSENSPVCYGELVQIITPEILNANYTWTGPNNFTSNTKNILLENVTTLDAGVYTLVVEVDGCISDPSQTVVTIENKLPTPMINPIEMFCEGTDVSLELLNADSTYTYEWFMGESNQAVGTGNPLLLQNIEIESAGTYFVVASSSFCSSDASSLITIEIESLTEAIAFAGRDTIICQSDFLLGQDASQSFDGSWSFLNENDSSSILNPEEYSSLVVDLKEGINELVWTLSDDICSENTIDTVSITYLAPPVANDDSYTVGLNSEFMSDVTLNDSLSTFNIAVSLLSPASMGAFDLNNQGLSTFVPNENFIGIDSIEYLVCYELCPADCDKATAVFNVVDDFECFIPSTFTPNGDGFNDYFDIPFLSRFPQSTIYIYNRWGDQVYFSNNYRGEWQGNYGGDSLPAGTYYYRLEVNDQEQRIKNGYVFIQR